MIVNLLKESLIKQVQEDLHEKSRIETMEEGLARARAAIRKAIRTRNYTSYKKESFVPRGSIYINPYAFHQLSSSIYRHDLQFRLIFYPKVEIVYTSYSCKLGM